MTMQDDKKDLPAYEAPQLTVLDASETKSGPTPDPTELSTFFEAFS